MGILNHEYIFPAPSSSLKLNSRRKKGTGVCSQILMYGCDLIKKIQTLGNMIEDSHIEINCLHHSLWVLCSANYKQCIADKSNRLHLVLHAGLSLGLPVFSFSVFFHTALPLLGFTVLLL